VIAEKNHVIQNLRSMALKHMGRDADELSESENEYLNHVIEMLVDMDCRFALYPVFAAQFVARCVTYAQIDHAHLLTMLNVLVASDKLKGR